MCVCVCGGGGWGLEKLESNIGNSCQGWVVFGDLLQRCDWELPSGAGSLLPHWETGLSLVPLPLELSQCRGLEEGAESKNTQPGYPALP